MNINAAIIDQRLTAVADSIRERSEKELEIKDEPRLKSLAFVFLTVKTVLDLSDDDAFECLTEGGNDFGIDAMHISEELDSEFTITIFQGKYVHKNLDGENNFPETGIHAMINAIRHIFNPYSELKKVNERLKVKVEEVRSLIRDGFIPVIRAIACNNGLIWNEAGEEAIKRENFGGQVNFEHINHEWLVRILQTPKKVSASLNFSGKAMVEDYDFSRVFIGRVAVSEIADLMGTYGERLLERNIRRYLGLQGNRVNEAISNTLTGTESDNFYFYNNGITLTCDKFSYNALQKENFSVKIENLQIINGGQTCMTIYKTFSNSKISSALSTKEAFVLVRLYQLPSENDEMVRNITYATNSQNPVDLRDLRANDEIQKRIEIDISQLGYNYRRKRTESSMKLTDITAGVAAEAVLSVWRKKPHQAKFFTREHFGKLYRKIFTNDLTGAQVIIAALIYRFAENKRKRPPEKAPEFVPYASCFISMQMGKYLLKEMNCEEKELTHKNFTQAKKILDEESEQLFQKASNDIEKALKQLYGSTEISPQQLSATFRRGDLIEKL